MKGSTRTIIFLTILLGLVIPVRSPAQSTDKHALVIDGANFTSLTSTDIQTISNEVIGTGVKWVLLDALWTQSEPTAPTATCQPAKGPHCYCGPKAACHNYNFTSLDQFVNAMTAAGIQVGIRFFHHPIWAGGQTCTDSMPACGVILSNHMTLFQNNLYDLAFNLATRYNGRIAFWIIWNEPNQANSFSPQDLNLGSGNLINEYMELVEFQGRRAILAVNPNALTVGPELFVPDGGGQAQFCDYFNHCMWLYGTGEWEDALLRYFSVNYPIFSIHNYSGTDAGSRTAIANLWNNVMVPLGKQRQIWLTEFNFGSNGTCSLSEQTILNYTTSLYNLMANQRAFYFAATDAFGNPGASCGDGLLRSNSFNWGEKPTLYPGFRHIITGQ